MAIPKSEMAEFLSMPGGHGLKSNDAGNPGESWVMASFLAEQEAKFHALAGPVTVTYVKGAAPEAEAA